MLSPSEFNSAVPKFANGNYANNPIDPQYIEEPTLQDYSRGVEPLETLPAQWWNWLCNQFTSRFNKINTYVKNIFDEITGLLSLLNVLPDGTESAITTGQLKNFFKELYPGYVSDKLSLGLTYVPQTRTVNGHALTENITVTKADVDLGNVVNTGDSGNASNGGTTKFTTGGAYNILTSIAPIFSTSTAYSVGTLVTYLNKFYECTTAHSAGAWNASHFTARTVSYIFTNYILPSFAPSFSTATAYSVGTFVIYQNRLYKCTTAHSAGAWNASHFALATLNDLATAKADKVPGATNNDIAILDANGNLKDSGISVADLTGVTDLAPLFSTTASYAVGEYVIYNENMYRCTVVHTGAWNANDFTQVTVGGELTNKADISDLAVPSDAVLHYSFDEIPDYPDGTAYYKKDNDFTDTTGWAGSATATVSNGKTTLSGGTGSYARYNISLSQNQIILIRGVAKVDTREILFSIRNNGASSDTILLKTQTTAGQPIEMIGVVNAASNGIVFYSDYQWEIEISQIYIGNGSYNTPIINNANGQRNAINNGGISINGVSGKGVYLTKNANIRVPFGVADLAKSWTVSFWVKLNRGETQAPRLYSIGYADYCFCDNFSTTGTVFSFVTHKDATHSVWVGVNMSAYIGTYCLITIETEIQPNGATTKKVYVNGELKGTGSGTITQLDYYPTSTIGCGQNFQGSFDKSIIDDFQIFNRILSEPEIKALYYNKANTPKYYDLDDYKFANSDTAPTANSNNFVQSKTLYNFFGGNTSAQSWLGKVFGWALGKNWTQATGFSTTPTIFCIHHANGIWVAGSRGIYWSTDGMTWTQVTGSISNKEITTIYYANGVWVAGTFSNGAWWSTDGITWTQGTGSNTKKTTTCIYYANNIWVAGSNYTGVWWSTDGKSWTQGSNTSSYVYDVYYGNNIWVLSCNDGLWWSTDGKNWTKGTTNAQGTVDPRVVHFANGEWKAGYSSGILKSTDGKDWTVEISTGNFIDIYYANGTWVAVSNNVGVWFQENGSWIQTDLTFNSISVYYSNNTWVINTQNKGFWWSSNGETWMPSNISNYVEGQSASSKKKTVFYGNGIWVAGGYNRAGLWWSSYENAGLK